MAKTVYKEVTTTGPIEWARIFEFNRDMEGYQDAYADCEGAYTLTQILNKEQFEKLKKSGSMKKPIQSKMMDGIIAVKFERKHLVKTKAGEIVPKAGGAPIVVKADGTPWNPEEDGLIGNGSIAEVTNLIQTFEVTNEKGVKEKASRTALSKVKIVELVQYIKEEAAA
ncbi:hypothetical protein UFOVP59_29 [uncultured Caudovirales phage]|uniref:Uncharacterized protein n=1 Tax=uncultured Caudovirales phage TaxID=2100421 RepID=A0A6J7WRJ5_9CAUD|nr:hypothetical protein UFOVP59_29 [uncultured Caudovirales phage]CAB5220546.1 hypothetical protein UFOVP246_3 [uncultured Caudovirales phage]